MLGAQQQLLLRRTIIIIIILLMAYMALVLMCILMDDVHFSVHDSLLHLIVLGHLEHGVAHLTHEDTLVLGQLVYVDEDVALLAAILLHLVHQLIDNVVLPVELEPNLLIHTFNILHQCVVHLFSYAIDLILQLLKLVLLPTLNRADDVIEEILDLIPYITRSVFEGQVLAHLFINFLLELIEIVDVTTLFER